MAEKTVKHKYVGEELDSIEWESETLHELPSDSILLTSKPPSGKYKVTNLYVDPSNGRLTVEYDDTPI